VEAPPGDRGEVWDARLEVYLSNPAEEPDPEAWRTEIAYLVADEATAG
jgi:hypothetical protein